MQRSVSKYLDNTAQKTKKQQNQRTENVPFRESFHRFLRHHLFLRSICWHPNILGQVCKLIESDTNAMVKIFWNLCTKRSRAAKSAHGKCFFFYKSFHRFLLHHLFLRSIMFENYLILTQMHCRGLFQNTVHAQNTQERQNLLTPHILGPSLKINWNWHKCRGLFSNILQTNAQHIQEGKSGAYQMLSSVGSIALSILNWWSGHWQSIKTLCKKWLRLIFMNKIKF